MDDATNFSLDIQQMCQDGSLTNEKFQETFDKYGGNKREDGITVDFRDGSCARWRQDANAWQLNLKD